MWLVILFGLIVVLARFVGSTFGEVTAFGLTFTAGTGLLATLLPLRDIIQERNNRGYALLAMLIGTILSVLLFGGNAIIIAVALFWTEVIDFALYSYFRKYGWGVAIPVSDLLSAPLTPLIYFWLKTGDIGMPDGQLFAKVFALLAVYGIIFSTNLPSHVTSLPKWIIHQERGEARNG